MKKVILAVLMAATKEGILCSLTVGAGRNTFDTTGTLKLVDSPNPDVTMLHVWRNNEKSILTLALDDTDLTVGTNTGKYEVTAGNVCITFQEAFQTDPFTVSANV